MESFEVETKVVTFRGFEVQMILVDGALDIWVGKAGPSGEVKTVQLCTKKPVTLAELST